MAVHSRSPKVQFSPPRYQRPTHPGSVEWDFSDGGSSSSGESPFPVRERKQSSKEIEITLSHARVWEQGSTVNGRSLEKLYGTKNLSRSISFALDNEIKNCDELDESRLRSYSNNSNSGRVRREVDPSVYADTLQRPTTGILHNGKERHLRPDRGGSLGRKSGVVSNSRLPIQHEIRFPGSNYGPPQIPVLSPNISRRKWSSSVPEGLNQIERGHHATGAQSPLLPSNAQSADEAELPGGETEIQKPEVDFIDEKLPPENGVATIVGEAKKHRPPPLTISSTEKNDTLSLSSLKRATSRSSIASVKEKILLSMPNEIRKKPEDNPLRCVVAILFALCLGMVLSAHIMYNQHIGEVRIFERVRLEEAHRNLMVYGPNNSLVITGQLGVQMPHDLHSYSCLPTGIKKEGVKCLEWKNRVKLEMMMEEKGGVTCHRVMWTALNKDTSPIDCWPVGPSHGHWYGGGESLVSKWPLDKGKIKLSPFVTGDEDQTEWGNVIRKFFINSQGISITIEDDTPLSVSLNDEDNANGGHRGLCFQANFDDFPYYYHRFNLPVLNYTVCTDGNLKEVYQSQLVKSFWDGHQDSDMEVLERLLQLPLWQVPGAGEGNSYTPEIIEDYLIGLIGRGNGKPVSKIERGYLLLDYHWQENMGDFFFNKKKFPDLKMVQDIVRGAGLRLALTINPFVSVDSKTFKEGVKEGLFVMERNSSSEKNIPALTWFKDVPVAALLDITNNKTVAWLKSKLSSLIEQDASEAVFFLDTGNTFHIPHFFTFTEPLPNPDLYKDHFIKHCMNVVKVIGVSGASSKRPKAPAFVWMTPLESSWSSLQSIIPNVLNLGVIGYPFINPGPIGGRPANHSHIPDLELFTRWWQLATFLPQLHFLTPPAAYRKAGIAPIAKKLKDIKDKIVNPLLLKYAGEAMEKSLPLIRPMWMLNPLDDLCQTIQDQFMIGDRILVAPVLQHGQTKRAVYLPSTPEGPGVWKRGTDGTYFEGGQWLNNSLVPLDEVLYFERKAEHVRPGHM